MTSAPDASEDDGAVPPQTKVAAETLALRARPDRITRLNARTVLAIAGTLATATLIALLLGLNPPDHTRGNAAGELFNVDHNVRPERFESLAKDYSQLASPRPASGSHTERPDTATTEPLPYASPHPSGVEPKTPELADAEEDEQARLSPLFFQASHTRPASDPVIDPDRLDRSVQNLGSNQALRSKTSDAQMSESALVPKPASPYQIMAGTVIAAALVTGIKSDLPGDVIATVTEPVYDTATGAHVLIPQGARLLGRYDSQIRHGQSRVDVVWHRLIFPDTSSLKLDTPTASDPQGYAGLEDGVDWHWDRVFAGAALTSLLGIGAELAAPSSRDEGDRIVIAGRDSLQDSANQVGQEITRRNVDIRPTLTQRPGLPLRIIVNRDIPLRPYRPLPAPIHGRP
ncbi:conjugal transfer protein TrbI [Pseudomonas stutzeri]|uniref:TrbI/VirB10 family protein n=1 Tax=Stutzerimonas stutzeri TaxID=316 RepID=UPI00210CC168|nr:TrbI/VirB10 family protein [Stutzerimonas stutzeri]MCQ4298150.1 conjugal transfer protein TrbI [Stutzerimonas stutzeri]